jgi:hypothetical protein
MKAEKHYFASNVQFKQLCKPRTIREYRIEGMEDVLKKRGMDLDQRVVAPCDLLNY